MILSVFLVSTGCDDVASQRDRAIEQRNRSIEQSRQAVEQSLRDIQVQVERQVDQLTERVGEDVADLESMAQATLKASTPEPNP